MEKEKDPLADYFPSPEEEYSAYKKRKREKEENEKREKAKMERQDSDNQSSGDSIGEEKVEIPNLDDNEFTLSDAEMDELDRWEQDSTDADNDNFPSKENCRWSLLDSAESLTQEQLTTLLRFFNQDEEALSESENDAEKKQKFVEWLGNNKKAKSLLELKERINESETSEDLRDKIRELGIYAVDEETISLQHAVNFSRKRVSIGTKPAEPKIDSFSDGEIRNFLSNAYSKEVSTVTHRLNYPNDYLWMDEDWKAIDDGTLLQGYHGEDYSEVNLEELETWPMYDESDVDIDVEVEINFQRFLKELKSTINKDYYKSSCWDIILRIPYSQISKASAFEIRLIDFLHQQKIRARVSISIGQPEIDIEERACLYASLLKIH